MEGYDMVNLFSLECTTQGPISVRAYGRISLSFATSGDCQRKYYGQTKRNINKRFDQHMKYVAKNEPKTSAIAVLILNNNH